MKTQNKKIQTVMLATLALGVNAQANMADTSSLRAESYEALIKCSDIDLADNIQTNYQDSNEESFVPATCCGCD